MTTENWLLLLNIGMVALVAGINLIIINRVKTVHIMMNSRLTELLKVSKANAYAEGAKDQKDKSNAASN